MADERVEKRARYDCLLDCQETDPDAHLTSLKDHDSWKTLLNAAETRKYVPLTDLVNHLKQGEIPDIKYHSRCRKLFTLKKSLQSLGEKEESEKASPTESQLAKCTRSSTEGIATEERVYQKVCIFCLKKDKYRKGTRTREKITQCRELRADVTVREAATRNMDTRILALLSREIVSAEAHYHWSCYRDYTRVRPAVAAAGSSLNALDGDSDPEDRELKYDDAVQIAKQDLFSFIRKELIVHPDVITLVYLTKHLSDKLTALGFHEILPSTKKNLRRNLETEFGDALNFVTDYNGRVLVYPASLSQNELVLKYHAVREKFDKFKENSDDTKTILNAAEILRNCIKSQEISENWPPSTTDVGVPEIFSLFLTSLLKDDSFPSKSGKVERLIMSFGQDIVYAISNGQQKPAKHVLLPYAVKSLTGNVQLIHILNRLGHSVSYSMMEEIDTALSLQKLSNSTENVPIPLSLHSGAFTTLAWDNIDRIEETLSGGGTSHRVNGIAIQQKDLTNMDGPPTVPSIPKTKQRCISSSPTLLPIYNAGKRKGPKGFEPAEEPNYGMVWSKSSFKNIAWIMARLSNLECQTVSGWTGFNIKIRDNIEVVEDMVTYLPTVNAPATDTATVHEVLNQSLKIMDNLKLHKIVCVFDQALYAKALDITWKHPETFSPIICRMGVFHTVCTMLATIGKRFGEAGLRDLCVESGVVAGGSVSGVLDGRKYNRAIRVHKLVYESLMRIAWCEFLNKYDGCITEILNDALEAIKDFSENITNETLNDIMNNSACSQIIDLFKQYLDYLRHDNGKLSSFWMSYVDMVEIVLGLVRGSREGDWLLHLASVRAMIPWCFAYDRLNYARYLPFYYEQMIHLEVEHPEVYLYFMAGGFSVQLGPFNPFGRIPVDQTIEETINRDTQTPGGTKGFSLKEGALHRYYLNAEYRSQYLRQLREMTGLSGSSQNHPDLQETRIKRDERDVQSLHNLLDQAWVNPFKDVRESILNIATGSVPSAEIEQDLLDAHNIGELAYRDFRKNRLQSNLVDFHATMPKKNLKTFSTMSEKKVKCKGKEIILKADRRLFGHMLIIAQTRQLDMKEVLSHPLAPIPWALANGDTSLRKTDKAKLMKNIAQYAPVMEKLGSASACVIDGMSIIQRANANNKTFGELATDILKKVLREGETSDRIDVVFDVYHETSIKNAERVKRGLGSGVKFRSLAAGQKIQQWRSFLTESHNKNALIKIIKEEWTNEVNQVLIGQKQLFVTCGEKCWRMGHKTVETTEDVPELESTQEEADTRMILHVKHASECGFKKVIVVSEDTDVFVILLGFAKQIKCDISMKRGSQSRTQYIDIRKLSLSLGDNLCEALIGYHAFTGCDTVSAFCGRGKTEPLKILMKHDKILQTFINLGKGWDISQETLDTLEAFVCRMYVPSSKTVNVNDLRYELFVSKRGEVDSSALPPCKDSLLQHIRRANYQAGIWWRSLVSKPDVPDPEGHGWSRAQDGMLKIDWMHGQTAPDSVLEFIACHCKKQCRAGECSCLDTGLNCTYMCQLQDCENRQKQAQDFTDHFEYSHYDSETDEEDVK